VSALNSEGVAFLCFQPNSLQLEECYVKLSFSFSGLLKNVGVLPANPGLVPKPLLEGRDGVDVGWSTEQWQDDICERDSCK